MDQLKQKINKMIFGLKESIEKNTKAREVAETANKTKSEFLANMSHEIRTPMNGIIGMTQLSLDTELTTYQREMLSTVHQLANSLLTIIDDILDISKIEANRMDIERIPFPIRGTIFNALKSLSVKANERGLNLVYEVDAKTLDYVIGDSFRLRQIIINLVGNAIKFTESGEVKVTIAEADQSKCGPNEYNIKFAVSDTGIGIHGDKLDVIFDTFQQADGSTTRRFGGTGLGLSISKKLVSLMGGRLWVESVYGKGSIFHFTCKYQRADPALSTIADHLKPFRRHNVLFLDRGLTGCTEDIIKGLHMLELNPTIRRPGETQEQPIGNSNNFDCIVVDCSDTARSLRKVEKLKYMPIVLLAPKISVSFRSALEDGITSYMNTPCLPIDLGNALLPALETRANLHKHEHSRSFDILLAEDNVVNQKLARRILEKYEHNVTVANNGLEALEAVSDPAQHFDIVLMDVQMPIMGGFEATAKIREWEKLNGVPRIPILALTAHAMLGDREKCLQAEMDDYLSKPLRQAELIQRIVKYAAMSGAMQEKKHTRNRRSQLITEQAARQAALSKEPPEPQKTNSSSGESTNKSEGQADGSMDSTESLQVPLSHLKRPGLGPRGATEVHQPLESPSILQEDEAGNSENPFDRIPYSRSLTG